MMPLSGSVAAIGRMVDISLASSCALVICVATGWFTVQLPYRVCCYGDSSVIKIASERPHCQDTPHPRAMQAQLPGDTFPSSVAYNKAADDGRRAQDAGDGQGMQRIDQMRDGKRRRHRCPILLLINHGHLISSSPC